MKNATKMARYMIMRGNRDGGNYERENEVRNGYGGYGNEGGNYARDNYGVDNRFRDRRGREHYDNGRFAPRNDMGRMESDYFGPYGRRDGSGGNYSRENRGGREGEMRGAMDDEDGMSMNMIGFDRPQEVSNHYPTRIDYQGGDEMEHRSGDKMRGGAMGVAAGLDKETAERWVHSMRNSDGTEGEHWRLDQIKAIMSQKAIDRNPYELYAVMNAMYSDYGKALKKRGVTTADAYLDMAIAFLDDPDAVPNKAMMYYEYIVKH